MASDKDYGLIIAAIVAIVAIVGLVIMFSGGGSTGSYGVEYTPSDNICYFSAEAGHMICTGQDIAVQKIFNLKDAGQVPFVPGQRGGTFGESQEHRQATAICYWSTEGCTQGENACQICEYRSYP